MIFPCLMVVAIFCPPLAIYLNWGCGSHFFFNIFLTSFVWLLGIGHAWIMVTTFAILKCKDRITCFMEKPVVNPIGPGMEVQSDDRENTEAISG
ncbi:hypothetical protein V3C99_008093 [Haemonchus contortus]